MDQAIPTQHPAVVLRSRFNQLRALLAVAMIAVGGLTAGVVILATDDSRETSAPSATQVSAPSSVGSTRYNGGPEEGTRGVVPARQPGIRYDGGPEEGTAALTQRAAPATRPQFDQAAARRALRRRSRGRHPRRRPLALVSNRRRERAPV